MILSFRFVRSLFVSLLIISTISMGLGPIQVLTPAMAQVSGSISVWWPVDGANVSGVQPFKALVDGMSVDSYTMYWQVDNGQLNSMSTNWTDAPHKEATVDLSGWHWQASGTYQITFVAKDAHGNVIAERTVAIHVNVPSGSSSSVSNPAPNPVTNPTPIPTPVTNPTPTSVPVTTSPSQTASESIWWPTDNVTVTGTQPFKARIENLQLSDYSIYWQVDNGQLNSMSDANTSEGPHKESSVDLSGWLWHGTGPYTLNFVAKDHSGNLITQKSVTIYTGAHSTSNLPTSPSPDPVSDPAPVTDPVTTSPASPSNGSQSMPVVAGNPLSGLTLYVDPNSQAANQVKQWVSSDPSDAALINKIASQPAAKWLGDWNTNIYSDTKSYVEAAAAVGQVPVLIAYNIPGRDCGGYSSGGAQTSSDYNTWISNLAAGIGSRKAIVILEPDALAGIDCLSSSDQSARYSMLNNAISTLKANHNTLVYVDAGNSNWVSASDMASRLTKAGVAKSDGFALNVSNYYWTQDNINYGQSVSALIGNKHFIVDTSRNGLGPLGSQWCNPPGRAIGTPDTTATGNPLVDAFLWLKNPGESDGTCNGGPAAGVWWPDQALSLSRLAAY